jgi:isoleucyl-tRNA synthetase
MSQQFESVSDKLNFAQEEENILQFWKDIDAFQLTLKLSEGRPEYTFYDGPPFATGMPHYGHILAGTIKDTVTRYAHQTGHYVSRRFGWDCHGLPIEYEIDKTLGITDRNQVLEMGVATYNDACRAIVQRYTKEWEKTVTRLGRWIDFENDYKTMDPEFMESVWWVFKTIYDKGLVYRGYKVMPYSTACATPLSNFEAGLNYKDVNDPTCTVSFPLVDDPSVSLVAWTTTPWTLPSNLALCVNPSFEYVKIKDKGRDKVFIILEKRLCQLFPEVSKVDCTDERKAELYEVLDRMSGESLVGLRYTPLFPYFASLTTAFRVISDGYVTEEGGTGIVHQAPAFGEDDYRCCLNFNIIGKGEDLPCPVDANGNFTSEVPDFKGRYVKDADVDICNHLKAAGRLVSRETYFHSYPFCWRSETPLIYRAVPSWFVSVEKIKERLVANNLQTYWVPAFVQEKRFHNWLVDAKDWAISRNRFWGTPLPLWISHDLEEMIVVGSVDELEKLSGVRVKDLHKENVDHITIPSRQGKGDLKRVEEVFDCWFESGSMPYAQMHYPFENQDRFENGYPADFIAEGLDQTRGWFYTLMVLSTALFDKPAFKNLIVNGLVLAADGKKMSKRLKNYPDPNEVVNKYGADALRLYLINSPVVRADTLKFQEAGVNDVVRGVLLPWFNAFRFFVQCVERWEQAPVLDGSSSSSRKFEPTVEMSKSSTNDVDIWILAATMGLVQYVHQEMQAYRLYTVVPRLVGFIEELTNWYVRLNRDRLKGSSGDDEALLGLNVLYEVMLTMTQIMAPFTPFFSEYLYQHLRKYHPNYNNPDPSLAEDIVGKGITVHCLSLPALDESRVDARAEARFKTLQQAVCLARVARERRHIRNNLPLKDVLVVSANEDHLEALQYLKPYFMGEINAWEVSLSNNWQELCTIKVVPNWKDLGKRLGKDMKAVAKEVNSLTNEKILAFMESGVMEICGYELTSEDIVVKRQFAGDAKRYEACVSDDGSLIVAIDTTIDDDVYEELRARTLAAAVQRMRKAAGLVVMDKVEVFYEEQEGQVVKTAMATHASSTVKRIKTFPLPTAFMSSGAIRIYEEVIDDRDLSKKAVKIILTAPCVAVNVDAITPMCESESQAKLFAMYLQTVDMDSLLNQASCQVTVDGRTLSLERGVHYFASANEMLRGSAQLQQKHGILPVVDGA